MTTTQPTDLQPGTVVSYHAPTGAELAVVDQAAGTQLRVITATGACRYLLPETLTPYPVSDDATRLIQHCVHRFQEANWLLEYQLEAETATHKDTRERELALTDKIADMRRYAIDTHRRGDICRDGLDAFLADHHLTPYRPRFRAHLQLTADIEFEAHDTDTAETLLEDLDIKIHADEFPANLQILDSTRTTQDLEETADS